MAFVAAPNDTRVLPQGELKLITTYQTDCTNPADVSMTASITCKQADFEDDSRMRRVKELLGTLQKRQPPPTFDVIDKHSLMLKWNTLKNPANLSTPSNVTHTDYALWEIAQETMDILQKEFSTHELAFQVQGAETLHGKICIDKDPIGIRGCNPCIQISFGLEDKGLQGEWTQEHGNARISLPAAMEVIQQLMPGLQKRLVVKDDTHVYTINQLNAVGQALVLEIEPRAGHEVELYKTLLAQLQQIEEHPLGTPSFAATELARREKQNTEELKTNVAKALLDAFPGDSWKGPRAKALLAINQHIDQSRGNSPGGGPNG